MSLKFKIGINYLKLEDVNICIKRMIIITISIAINTIIRITSGDSLLSIIPITIYTGWFLNSASNSEQS